MIFPTIANLTPGIVSTRWEMRQLIADSIQTETFLPQDETVYEYDCEGKPTAGLPEENPVKMALREIVDKLVL